LANSIEVVANQATSTKNDVINLAGIVDLDHSNITQLRGDLATLTNVCHSIFLSHWHSAFLICMFGDDQMEI
jgi:hypothetical protein